MTATARTMGLRIKACRVEKDLSQTELAKRLGVTKAAVSQWETDRSSPEMDTLRRLAGMFGRTVEWMVSGDERQSVTYSDDEVELCRMFRKLSPEKRAALLLVGKGLAG
jgi:transcriptional regulator with XRE-family HTH domain